MSIIITINAKGTLHELFTINLQKTGTKAHGFRSGFLI